MKKTLFFISILLLSISCKNQEKQTQEKTIQVTAQTGETLFIQNNCATCHKTDQKIIGPSLQEIATIYTNKNASIASFLKEESPAIVDPAQENVMKINLQITKTMSSNELKSIELYILNQK